VKEMAAADSVRVTGSEIVGLVPLAAIGAAGRFYGGHDLDDRAAVLAAVEHLGLGDLTPFDPDKKVLEYVIAQTV
jgi:glutamate formiminotransferase/formiminotetrahydrofolate cyclodeaminase